MANKQKLIVLKKSSDFSLLMKSGSRVRPADWLLVNYVKNPDDIFRCGWTLPRNVGSAVVRNKLKRWLRVYFRSKLLQNQPLPVDVNVVFRKADDGLYKNLKYAEFTQILDRAWRDVERRIKKSSSTSDRGISIDRHNAFRR